MLVAPFVAFFATAIFKPQTENIVFVMTDGLRWQETFSGADKALLDTVKGDEIKKRFWRETPEARREALLPFLWSSISKGGQIYGNRAKGSLSQVTNGLNFSYPGYNETLCGYPDARIHSNDPTPNPNVTVFEWLNRKPGFKNRVAAFGAWDVISAVFNKARCGFVDNAGYEPLTEGKTTPVIQAINRIKAEQPRFWDEEPFDVLTFHTSLEYVKANRPRLLYLSLGETDDWAHAGKYDEYLKSANRFDSYVKELWNTLQSMPQYRNKTTLILTCDHGRGDGPMWTSHGTSVPHSEATWMAFLGPDTPAIGEVSSESKVTNSQIAATLANLLGFDYRSEQPKAAPAIEGVIKS
jgi:hypothetical protein